MKLLFIQHFYSAINISHSAFRNAASIFLAINNYLTLANLVTD